MVLGAVRSCTSCSLFTSSEMLDVWQCLCESVPTLRTKCLNASQFCDLEHKPDVMDDLVFGCTVEKMQIQSSREGFSVGAGFGFVGAMDECHSGFGKLLPVPFGERFERLFGLWGRDCCLSTHRYLDKPPFLMS